MNKKESVISSSTPIYYFDIAVPTSIFKTFTYSFDSYIEPGSRVSIPFGKRNIVGLVLKQIPESTVDPSQYEIKPILNLIDQSPIFSPTLLDIATWMSSYYFSPIGEVLKTMLPLGFNITKDSSLILSDKGLYEYQQQSDNYSILSKIFSKTVIKNNKYPTISEKTLLKKISPKEYQILIKQQLLIPRKYVQEAKLKTRNYTLMDQDQNISTSIPSCTEKTSPFELNSFQKNAISTILSSSSSTNKKPFLLFGVTGSGKTEVFLQLIQHFIQTSDPSSPSQILILVPEISLTPQMTAIFESRFGSKVSVVHSNLSDKSRWLSLENIRSNTTQILIGARSSVFASFKNLKLIIVDEEHDGSYKQNTGLTYNARDIAILRGNKENVLTVLASATPSLESYYNAITEKYTLITMPERIPGSCLPSVKLIEKKISFTNGAILNQNNSIKTYEASKNTYIDDSILEELEKNYNSHKQSIILVNRRGYAFYLISTNTSSPVICPNCSISLTYHKKDNRLKCHYCDFSISLDDFIKSYPDDKFVLVGYGSEKIESYLKSKLPSCSIARLDSDNTQKQGTLQKTLSDFRDNKIDILVGTQMLAKGHDFPKVSLVVLLEIDQILSLADFRAGEKTFQLLVQAAGRSGRSSEKGCVYIQTYRKNHPIIKQAILQDYESFAKNELEFRKSFNYPPYSRMILIEILSSDFNLLLKFCITVSEWLSELIQNNPSILKLAKITGPITPAIDKINTMYRKTLILTSSSPVIRTIVQKFYSLYNSQPITLKNKIKIKVDVDPQSLF